MSDVAEGSTRLAVLLGRADDMRAVVYVRVLDGLPASADSQPPRAIAALTGSLRGPRCSLATTLATTARLRELPPSGVAGDTLPTGEAVLVEPGYWSPELPNLYQLDLQITDRDGQPQAQTRAVGVRRLGHRDGAFRLEARRYVPRAVAWPCETHEEASAVSAALSEARASAAALWAGLPSAERCQAADAHGVMLVAELPAELSGEHATPDVARLALHPSVGFLVVGESHLPAIPQWRCFRGTMQVGLQLDARRPPPTPDLGTAPFTGIDFLVATLPEGAWPHESWRSRPLLPVMIRRPLSGGEHPRTITTARSRCDQLQADMAGWLAQHEAPAWEPAGYSV